jgi:16S rRNA C967 or C1407 C5-methylase (RsmB/RsmF family)
LEEKEATMGRKWKRRSKKKHNFAANRKAEKKPADPSKHGQERSPYALIEGGNFKMEAFYAYQGMHDSYLDPETGEMKPCTTDEEKEAERLRWLTSLKSILPASFRIGMDVDDTLRERLENEIDQFVGEKMEIEFLPKGGDQRIKELGLKSEVKTIEAAKKVPFIPHAYQLNVDRQTIRRNPQLEPFHDWLKIQTQSGFVTRQETVSMIPPVVLKPEPSDLVLDMCAAPGSKTSQLLETINRPANEGDTEPSGCVIANDADNKRAYMLVHQLKRINSPATFITNCDAQFFPIIRDPEHPSEGIFDKVLADVPCGGDGTGRKNPGIWKKWNQLNSYGLHVLQLAIALRGARLTKIGGYLCYSTCSQNPIENEAVVAELLRASEGSLELVDPRQDMEGLLARPGWSSWRVLSEKKTRRRKTDQKKDGETKTEQDDDAGMADEKEAEDEGDDNQEGYGGVQTPFKPESFAAKELKKYTDMCGLFEYDSFEDVPPNLRRRIRQTCFPPTTEEAEKFHLERCLRVLPHDMDTGGFFVALLKKVAPMNARAKKNFETLEKEMADEAEDSTVGQEPEMKKSKIESSNVETKQEDKLESRSLKSIDPSDAGDEIDEADDKQRGVVKKNFLKEKDGKKHATLGEQDFVPIPKEMIDPLIEYYGLSASGFNRNHFMQRASGDSKVLYFLGKAVMGLLDLGIQQRVTVVTSGLKAFTKNHKECEVDYRLSQEGVHFIAPYMTKRKLTASLGDFEKCLDTSIMNIPLESFSEEFREEVRPLSWGSFVVQLKGFENNYLKKMTIVMWRNRGDSLNCLVGQAEVDGMKSKLRSVSATT